MAEQHQLPSQQQQQLQGAGSWYPAPPPHQYQPQPPPLQQQQQPPPNVQWTSAPPPGQSLHYPPPQPYQQGGDFFSQAQHFPAPPHPQHGPPQFTYMYGQQDQVWPTSNNWGYQQWTYPGQSAGFPQQEDWAAKARAWAAAKAALDNPQPPQPSSTVHQAYQNYQQQELQMLNSADSQLYSIHPPGQEVVAAVVHDSVTNQGQKLSSKPLDQPIEGRAATLTSEYSSDSSELKLASGGVQAQSSNVHVIPSSHSQDTPSSYVQDNSITGVSGTGKSEPVQQQALQPSAAPSFSQQQPRFISQSQSPLQPQQQRFSYSEQPSPPPYEFHQPQQLEFQHHPPQNYQQQQQQQLPQFRPVTPMTMDGLEAEFGMSSASMQNWPPIGGHGMPFPPAVGAGMTGSSQFDHPHPPLHQHQITPTQPPMFGRPHGPQQGLGFPPVGPGLGGPFGLPASPGLGPGPGGPLGPMFLPDGNGNLGFPERPKKAAVPSWLREELMKKKAAGLAGASTGSLTSEESNQVNGQAATHRFGSSDRLRNSSPGLSEEDEDGTEAEIEAARNAAINQEIKRVLTEVLLKVTGDLFDEIADEVLEEEEEDFSPGKKSTAGEDDRPANILSSSPSPLAPVPSAPARVLISSLKNHDTNNDDENASLSSDSAAGNVLGLATYDSDDDDGEKKKQPHEEEREEKRESSYHDGLSGEENSNQDKVEDTGRGELKAREHSGSKDGQSGIDVEKGREKYAENDRSISKQSGGREDEEVEKRREEDVGRKRLREKSAKSPVRAHGYGKEFHVDNQNHPEHKEMVQAAWKLDGTKSQTSIVESKEEQSQASRNLSKEKPNHSSDVTQREGERNAVRNRVSSSAVEEKEHRRVGEKHEKRNDIKEGPVGKEELATTRKVSPRIYETSKKKEKETREGVHAHKSLDAINSGKEKRKEERSKDSDKKKGTHTAGDEKALSLWDKDSNKEKRKEKMKERGKDGEKEQERSRRKFEKEKNERKGRDRRMDTQDTRRSRHRSSSASSRGSRSVSSSSQDSRRRHHSKRSNKHQSSSPSPGRSRKRRVSRSRSRSPHAKPFHRRNSLSPSREKSRHEPRSRSPRRRRRN